MRRTVWTLVLAMVMAVTAGCANAGSTDPGCGECTDELAQVRRQVEALPDVARIKTLQKYGASPTNGATVKLEIRSRGTGDTGVADDVAEIVWKSRLVPVDVVMVTIEDSTGELVPTLPYDFRADSPQHETYVQQLGERPVDQAP